MSIEPLGIELPMYDITTGTGDFIANGVVSHNCFARPTHEYLDFDAGRDFEREIVVKVNVPEVLRAELARPSWKGEHVALGTNTDPYQWVEGRYQLMRGIWEALRDAAQPVLDPHEVAAAAARPRPAAASSRQLTDVTACLSVPTLDEKAWRATEPHTPHPRARLEAVAELNRAGHPDRGPDRAADAGHQRRARSRSSEIVELAGRPGATSIGGQSLFLRGLGARRLLRLAARAPAGSLAALRAALRGAAPTSPARRAARDRAAGGPAAPGICRVRRALPARRAGGGRPGPPPAQGPPAPAQEALF